MRNGKVHISKKDRFSALLAATVVGHLPVVRYLLLEERKAGITEESINNYNAVLLAAIVRSHLLIVQLLLKEGGTERSKNGATALLLAVKIGHLSMVLWLLKEEGATIKTDEIKAVLDRSYRSKFPRRKAIIAWLRLFLFLQHNFTHDYAELDAVIYHMKEASEEEDKTILLDERLYLLGLLIDNGDLGLSLLLFNQHKLLLELSLKQQQALLNKLLRKNQFETIMKLMPYLDVHACLKGKLVLQQCQIKETHYKSLEAIIQKSQLTTLLFSEVKFDPDVFHLFCLNLPKITLRMKELFFTACALGDNEIAMLCSSLQQLPELTHCSFDGNHLTYAGFTVCIKQLSQHQSMTHLSLRRNYIEQASGEYFKKQAEPLLSPNTQLKQIDISENYFLGEATNKNRYQVLQLLLTNMKITPAELKQAIWVGITPSDGIYTLTYELHGELRKVDLTYVQLRTLNRYQQTQGFVDLSEVFQDVRRGLQMILLQIPSLAEKTVHDKSEVEQKAVCKQLLYYHSEATLKHQLLRHSIFHIERTDASASLIFPEKILTRDQWQIYLLAHKGSISEEHAMLAFEGLLGCGQRFLKIAHLQAVEESGLLGGYKVRISYFVKSMAECAGYLRENYHIAAFSAERSKVKDLQSTIDHEVNNGVPLRYSSVIFVSSISKLSQEQKEKIRQNCLTWAIEKIKNATGLKHLPIATGARPSTTVLDLIKMNSSSSGNQLQSKCDKNSQEKRNNSRMI